MDIKLEDDETAALPISEDVKRFIVNLEMNLLSVILGDPYDIFGEFDWKETTRFESRLLLSW